MACCGIPLLFTFFTCKKELQTCRLLKTHSNFCFDVFFLRITGITAFWKSGIVKQQVVCEWVRCHGGETSCFSSTCVDVCAECPPQPLQNLTVKLAIDGLTRGYEFLLLDSALDVERNYQHGLDIAANLTHFFRPWWIWWLPLRWLLLSLRVITIHPCFITGCDIGDEFGVVPGLLFEFPADRNAKGLLVVAQRSWHKSCRNASHVQIVRQNALNGPVWQSYYLTNIVDSLPTICKDSLVNFCYVFWCCASRRSSRTLIVVDRRSSILEAFVP